MKHYTVPHITSYTDAELSELTLVHLAECSSGYLFCNESHVSCDFLYLFPLQCNGYCIKSFMRCNAYTAASSV